MTKKAVAYARFSSDNQREESIDAQIRAIKAYCKEKDIELIKTYTDEALSATTDDRPGFINMVEESKILPIDYVIVHKLDRFARSRYDSAIYKKELKDNGVSLLSVLENLDGSPEAIILESLLEGMSEYYSANLSREVSKGMKENAYKAKYNGGVRPFGYNIDENKNYKVDPGEAKAIREIFKRYSLGHTQIDICNYLNEEGYVTSRNKLFKPSSLKRILENEKYIGIYKTKINGEEIEIENAIPPIVDKAIYNKIQAMKHNKSLKASKSSKNTYLLTGILKHKDCGYMQGQTVTNRHGKDYPYYFCPVCGKRIRTKKTDDTVLKVIEQLIFTEDNQKTLVDSIYTYFKEMSNYGALEAVNAELKNVDKKIENIVTSIAEMGGNDILYKKLNDLEDEKKRLAIRQRKEKLKFKPVSRELIVEVLKEFEDIKKLDTKKLKGILAFIISSITLDGEILRITLRASEGLSNKTLVGHEAIHLKLKTITARIA